MMPLRFCHLHLFLYAVINHSTGVMGENSPMMLGYEPRSTGFERNLEYKSNKKSKLS